MTTSDSHERLSVGTQQHLPTFVSKSGREPPPRVSLAFLPLDAARGIKGESPLGSDDDLGAISRPPGKRYRKIAWFGYQIFFTFPPSSLFPNPEPPPAVLLSTSWRRTAKCEGRNPSAPPRRCSENYELAAGREGRRALRRTTPQHSPGSFHPASPPAGCDVHHWHFDPDSCMIRRYRFRMGDYRYRSRK